MTGVCVVASAVAIVCTAGTATPFVVAGISAISGAVMSGTQSITNQWVQTGDLSKTNWLEVGKDALIGGATGFVTGYAGSAVCGVITSKLAGTAIAGSLINSTSVATRTATQFAIGSMSEVAADTVSRFAGTMVSSGFDLEKSAQSAFDGKSMLFDGVLGGVSNAVSGIKTPKSNTVVNSVDDFAANNSFKNNMGALLERNNINLDKFQELKLKPVGELTDSEVVILKDIRESVPKITTDTMLQKTIPLEDITKYLDGTYTEIGGYIAKLDDVGHIKNYDDVVESSRLDYTVIDGSRPFPENGDSYGKIEFKTNNVEDIDIPYGERFGGTNTDEPPCTQNGFTGSRNGEVIPEWRFNKRNQPKDGAKLYSVTNGEETLVGVFDADLGMFVKISN